MALRFVEVGKTAAAASRTRERQKARRSPAAVRSSGAMAQWRSDCFLNSSSFSQWSRSPPLPEQSSLLDSLSLAKFRHRFRCCGGRFSVPVRHTSLRTHRVTVAGASCDLGVGLGCSSRGGTTTSLRSLRLLWCTTFIRSRIDTLRLGCQVAPPSASLAPQDL
eukprot:scaffold2107_cov222-Pinguiococcus_pyrenoidosus.AAC.10